MEILKSKSVFFSPARKTGEIVSHFVSYLGYDAEKYNITSYKKRDTSVNFSSNDLAVFAYPVYGGRVPDIMVKQLDKMKADNTPAVIIAVYGNRAYEDALLEMQNLAKDKGFIVIAAAAFIANHSIMTEVAVNRPDDKDKEKIKDFAAAVKEKIKNIEDIKNIEYLQLPGDYPYRKYNGIPLKPTGDSKCTACGACVQNCPVNAIMAENPRKTDKTKCITCMGCAAICPQNARHLNKILHFLSEIPFKKKYGARKEPDIFV